MKCLYYSQISKKVFWTVNNFLNECDIKIRRKFKCLREFICITFVKEIGVKGEYSIKLQLKLKWKHVVCS
jgi:hypothetical protein